MIRRTRAEPRQEPKPEPVSGTYEWEVILTHPITKAEIKRFREAGKDAAYAFADEIASPSVVVDVKRVRVIKRK